MPKRIQLKRRKGWRIPANTVNVARGPGRFWGNPFVVGKHGDQETCVKRYRDALEGFFDNTVPSPSFAEVVAAQLQARHHLEDLRGKDLACWCEPGSPCHADVLIELANKDED